MKKILVTGGAGYIGSHTVVLLQEKGYEPIIVDDFSNSRTQVLQSINQISGKKTKCYVVDCNDKEQLKEVFVKESNIEGVIHFAAFKSVNESVEQPLKYYKNNINPLLNLLELIIEFNVNNLVFSSTCAIYGDAPMPVREDYSKQYFPKSPYGKSKKTGEEILSDFCIAYPNKNALVLRYFNPIGAHPSGLIGEHPKNFAGNILPMLMKSSDSSFSIFGSDYNTPDGTCLRDYIDIMDLASAHLGGIEWLMNTEANGSFETFNIGTGNGVSVLEMVNHFQIISGRQINCQIKPRRIGDIERMYANVDKAREVLHWKSEVPIEVSIRNAWAWIQKISD